MKLIFVLIFSLLSACTTIGTPINWDAARKINVGMSHDDLMALMGNPTEVTKINEDLQSYTWTYYKPNGFTAYNETFRINLTNGKVDALPSGLDQMKNYGSPARSAVAVEAVIEPLVSVIKDEFADRYEITSRATKFNLGDELGFYFVSSIVMRGATSGIYVTGSLAYDGDWRFYDHALLRGGVPVVSVMNDRKVISCRGRACSLRESFKIAPTQAQINKYAKDGVLEIQVRSRKTASKVLLSIPVEHFAAVRNEAAKYIKKK